MELVYCFFGMAIFCAGLCIIFSGISLWFISTDKEIKAEKTMSLARSFADCGLFFLILEMIGRFFV